ncbi:RodZ domain-containing protein [Halomonas urumqiensis]|uniref:DUF4115 domain-containing protein n=1 Tax=Halomonas urumqiensis TaxID=1684789 RepID=A0A2N7UMX4_9GAMM|nr:RodZ domain-containing protein [Halomonas urumqiensis]PMR81762.1 DUF4115 domain-containing protein [Halomonas urumqiensis]PTB02399.1 DUF4115 domain-containing protein [Halomonas urumqiensis]GHE21883.1 cytoskeleton protein RodZ [Halomonas urumqiensis]
MSDTHFTDTADTAVMTSPGELLKRERENQGLSLAEVATALNLRPAVIRGLEEDSYEEVPVAAYRRGYLRSYAGLLGIDDQPVLDAYRARFAGEDTERKVSPVNVTRPPSRLGAWLFRLVTVLVIAGLIGLTLMWWQSRGGNEPPGISDSGPVSVDSLDGTTTITEGDTPAAESAAGLADDQLPPLPDDQNDLGLVDEADDDSQTANPVSGESSVASDGGSEPAGVDPQPAEALGAAQDTDTQDPDTQDTVAQDVDTQETASAQGAEQADQGDGDAATARTQLQLTFNEQSWTEIFDASNERVFVGLQEPGTTASVEGEPPFRLTVGNATGVELTWSGEPVDLSTRAGANNVARFTLGE